MPHRAAGALWALDGIEPGQVELLTTRSRTRPPAGVDLHHTTTLPRSDFGMLGVFRVTGMVRTLIDLGAVLDPAPLEEAVESAYRKNESVLPRLQARVEELGTSGRAGVRAIREILAARDPAAAPTEAMFERRLSRLVRDYDLPEPVRQYAVQTEDGHYRIDFAHPHLKLAIETDGYWCHTGRARWRKGLRRGNALTLEGWRVLHVTWSDLVERPEAVAAMIRQGLAQG